MNKDNVCKYCKSNINKEAVICPHCKKDLRSWWRRHPILTIIFILFITPILISAIGDKTFKTDTSQNTVDKIKKKGKIL